MSMTNLCGLLHTTNVLMDPCNCTTLQVYKHFTYSTPGHTELEMPTGPAAQAIDSLCLYTGVPANVPDTDRLPVAGQPDQDHEVRQQSDSLVRPQCTMYNISQSLVLKGELLCKQFKMKSIRLGSWCGWTHPTWQS